MTSSIDLRPKFGIALSSDSDFWSRSPTVCTPARLRQLSLRRLATCARLDHGRGGSRVRQPRHGLEQTRRLDRTTEERLPGAVPDLGSGGGVLSRPGSERFAAGSAG